MADEIEKTKEPEIEEVSEEQVHFMVEFARELEKGLFPGIYTPDLVNSRMRDISYNPIAPLQQQLDDALKSPKTNEDNLRNFGQSFEIQSQTYKRLISYLGNLLSWDYTIDVNATDPKDYKTPAYLKDLAKVNDFFTKFSVKQEFGTVVKQLIRNEAMFFVTRFDGDRYVLQEMPADYCKITARFDYGLLYDFNFLWFLQSGVDINSYPAFFREKFVELFTKSGQKYIPDIPVDMRGSNMFAYWVSIPPEVGFCFKLSQENATRLPFFLPLFSDLILQNLMRGLQRDKSIISACKIIFGEVGMLDKTAKTTVRDAFNLDAKSLANFLTLLKSGIGKITASAAPLQNVQPISFPSEPDLYNSYLSNAVASSGVNSNLIFTSSSRPNILETGLSLSTDEQLMEAVYPQFDLFINYQLSKITKRFQFFCRFEGTNFYTNRQQRLEPLQGLIPYGIVLWQKIAAALGIEPYVFIRMLDEGKTSDIVSKLTPIISANQMSSAEQGSGRPKTSDTKITDSGSQTRQDGGNLGKGGKI